MLVERYVVDEASLNRKRVAREAIKLHQHRADQHPQRAHGMIRRRKLIGKDARDIVRYELPFAVSSRSRH